MGNLMRRQRHRGVDPWRDFFDNDFFGTSFPGMKHGLPAVNLSETNNDFNIELVAPGYKKEDFRLKVNNDILTISCETKNESEKNDGRDYSRREYSSSSFTRSFQLPDNAKDDAITASYEDGILQITIPKSEKEVKVTRDIPIG